MLEIAEGIGLREALIPPVCFAVCIGFQTWEYVGSHDSPARTRSLFKAVRAGWVKDQHMQGSAVCNTTRDFIKAAAFMANTAVTLATFTVGYAGSIYTDCSDDNDCTPDKWLFVLKLGFLAAVLLIIFFVFTQCARFAVHLSFCMNTKELQGMPMSHGLLVNVFEQSQNYFSLGVRLYFGIIPVFAWIFTPWALLAVTPVYVCMVIGLENTGFVKDELDKVARVRAASVPPKGGDEGGDGVKGATDGRRRDPLRTSSEAAAAAAAAAGGAGGLSNR